MTPGQTEVKVLASHVLRGHDHKLFDGLHPFGVSLNLGLEVKSHQLAMTLLVVLLENRPCVLWITSSAGVVDETLPLALATLIVNFLGVANRADDVVAAGHGCLDLETHACALPQVLLLASQ